MLSLLLILFQLYSVKYRRCALKNAYKWAIFYHSVVCNKTSLYTINFCRRVWCFSRFPRGIKWKLCMEMPS